MYPVSDAYKAAMKSPVQRFHLTGTIRSNNGITDFTEDDILSGSFSIANQCSGSDIVEIGTVYTGELDATFLKTLNLSRYSLKDQPIVSTLHMHTANGYEELPLGTYYIQEANWTASGVEVKAYDAMSKLDRNIQFNSSSGTLYDFAMMACNACGVEFGMTQAEVQALPNGSDQISIYQDNDIETWRDLMAWVAQTAGSFATCDRSGKIVLRQYDQNVVDTIDDDHRLIGGKFSDFETRYTGISVVDIASKMTRYYGEEVDDALSYNLGSNPLLQYGLTEFREKQCRAILDALQAVDYVPFEVSMIGNPAYDLGDVIVFSDGIADGSKKYCVTKYSWTYNGEYKATGVGENPALANAKSKSDKNLAGLMNESSSDVIKYYDYINVDQYIIKDQNEADVISFHYVTTKNTHVDFHAELKCKLETVENLNDAGDVYTEHDGVIQVSYNLNGDDIVDYYPVETMFDGINLLHLLYTWRSSANVIGNFTVTLKVYGCDVEIDPSWIHAYIAGQGIVGDDAWDGTVRAEDKITPIDVHAITIGRISDDQSVTDAEEMANVLTDFVKASDIASMLLGNIGEVIGNIWKLHRFDVAHNASEMRYYGVTNDGKMWMNADGVHSGTITTPLCSATAIKQITSLHSGDDVAYVVSFDQGTTWMLYTGSDWAEADTSQDFYGMLEGTMMTITESVWAEKLNGSIMVRAILRESATVTDIQIYMEEVTE